MDWKHDAQPATRRSLLVRLKDLNDQQSWQEFFDTYSGLIRAVAIKAGLTDCEAQEVVQETMIGASKKLPEFEYDPAKGKFKGWLLKLTRWRIDDQFRKRQPQLHRPNNKDSKTTGTAPEARIPDPRGGDLEAIWDEEWKENLFRVAIESVKRSVNAEQYQIFDLYVLKQWPAKKVATNLGITIGRVFLAKHRILLLVKKEISRLESEML